MSFFGQSGRRRALWKQARFFQEFRMHRRVQSAHPAWLSRLKEKDSGSHSNKSGRWGSSILLSTGMISILFGGDPTNYATFEAPDFDPENPPAEWSTVSTQSYRKELKGREKALLGEEEPDYSKIQHVNEIVHRPQPSDHSEELQKLMDDATKFNENIHFKGIDTLISDQGTLIDSFDFRNEMDVKYNEDVGYFSLRAKEEVINASSPMVDIREGLRAATDRRELDLATSIIEPKTHTPFANDFHHFDDFLLPISHTGTFRTALLSGLMGARMNHLATPSKTVGIYSMYRLSAADYYAIIRKKLREDKEDFIPFNDIPDKELTEPMAVEAVERIRLRHWYEHFGEEKKDMKMDHHPWRKLTQMDFPFHYKRALIKKKMREMSNFEEATKKTLMNQSTDLLEQQLLKVGVDVKKIQREQKDYKTRFASDPALNMNERRPNANGRKKSRRFFSTTVPEVKQKLERERQMKLKVLRSQVVDTVDGFTSDPKLDRHYKDYQHGFDEFDPIKMSENFFRDRDPSMILSFNDPNEGSDEKTKKKLIQTKNFIMDLVQRDRPCYGIGVIHMKIFRDILIIRFQSILMDNLQRIAQKQFRVTSNQTVSGLLTVTALEPLYQLQANDDVVFVCDDLNHTFDIFYRSSYIPQGVDVEEYLSRPGVREFQHILTIESDLMNELMLNLFINGEGDLIHFSDPEPLNIGETLDERRRRRNA